MDSLAPFQLTLNSTAVHINCCFNAFLAFVFSIESIEARLHHILNYVSSLQQGIVMRKGDVEEVLLRKIMIGDGITALLGIAKSIIRDLQSRSKQFAGVTGLDFQYSKQLEMGLGPYQQESGLNHLMGQAKMPMENRGGNLFQHRLSSIQQTRGQHPIGELRTPSFLPMNINLGQFLGEGLTNVAGGSSMLLIPLETYAHVKPVICNVNLVASVGTNINYAQLANQPKPQQNIQTQQRKVWTKHLQVKFKNAVQMLGGPKLATVKQILRVLKDENLTVGQVKSYLQSYRHKEKRTIETLKAFHDMISVP